MMSEPPTSPGRLLLADLDVVEGYTQARSARLRLELLNHLLAAPGRGKPSDPERLATVVPAFGVPGTARILSRLLEQATPTLRARRAHALLAQITEADDAARATVLVAVAPHLDRIESAVATAGALSAPWLRAAALFALGRLDEDLAGWSGELRARVRAVNDGFRTGPPGGGRDDPWWRAVGVAGPDRDMTDDALDPIERVAAESALAAVEDGAWHLLALRHHRVLAAVVADADRSGEGYLAALRREAGGRHDRTQATLLRVMTSDERAWTARELLETLAAVAARTGSAPSPATQEVRALPPPDASLRDNHRVASEDGSAVHLPAADSPRTVRRGLGRVGQRVTRGLRREPRREHGVVNTGFATSDDPDTELDSRRPLDPGGSYVFWLEIAPQVLPGSIEVEHVPLPAQLPSRARLSVVLFAYDGELAVTSGATHGVLELDGGGTALVVQQPGDASGVAGRRRLRFPVTAPTAAGAARLRCSIYHRGVLVQSRVVTANVGEHTPWNPDPRPALRSELDYQLFRTLEAESLEGLTEHRASLLLNHDGAGTHGLRFAAVDGEDIITRDVSIGEGVIGDQIRMARHALRRVSWGSDDEWSEGRVYRYRQAPDESQLTDDLVALAANGARFFQLLVEEVASSDPDDPHADPYLMRDRLGEVLRRPGRIQIALQRAPNHILPAALIYDHLFTDSAPAGTYRLCPDFTEVWRAGVALEQTPCFRGDCPQALPGAEPTVVCPSGFWGFRHELGFPVTHGDGSDATEIIATDGGPRVGVAVSTELVSHALHVQGLRGMVADFERWRLSDTRQDVLAGLCSDDQQIVYFYCHGGVADNVPYVRLGEDGARPITRLDLANARVRWATSRPLVVLNGCHTTALDPETAIDFVRFFVKTALASGVVGTEITVFEALGQAFGEALMKRFLTPGTRLGAAVRGARLDLLHAGNPLGLVYIPFALAGLRLGESRPEAQRAST
jgi:hypothetical protein